MPRRSPSLSLPLFFFLAVCLVATFFLFSCAGQPPPCPPFCAPVQSPTPTVTASIPRATPTASRVPTREPTATPTVPAQSGKIERVHSWTRPASEGRRVRLFDDGGRLLVAYGQAEGGSRYTALLEDAAGTRIDAQPYLTQKAPKVHAVKFAGGQLLTRDEDRLELGGMPLGVGGWESYSGLPGLILAWRTCAAGRQCWATIYSHGAETWTEHIWPAETFGIDVGQSSPGRVAIATRESPGSAGWTGRIVEELLLRQGIVRELGVWRWKPPAGLSLEDPHLVRGAAVPTLIGEAYDLRLGSKGAPSGRVFLAEVGGPLREILQVAAVPGNSEIYGAVMGGRLFVAAELDGARSGLWGWVDGKGLQLVGSAAGGAPCLVVAEGALWISTTAGLWRMG